MRTPRIWTQALRDMQSLPPAAWCLRCRAELYPGEDGAVCPACRAELRRKTKEESDRNYDPTGAIGTIPRPSRRTE